MAASDPPELMTSAAVARRLGIGRAAVTNWRRRYSDFPSPIHTDGTARFDWAEVSRWLVANGKGEQLARVGRTDTGTQLVTAPDEPSVSTERLVPSGQALATLSSETLIARAMVALLPPLDDAEDPIVLDPACGAGDRLVAAAERYGDRVDLVGRDVDEDAVETARRSLRNHPFTGLWDVEFDGPILRRSASAVLCVADPRVAPPTSEIVEEADGSLAWVLACLALVRHGAVAVVALPNVSATQLSGAAVRSDLVRTGLLREVVALPAFPDAPGGCLWVLRQTPGTGGDVRMIDLSELADPADLPVRAGAWHRLLDDADPAVVARVPRLTLLDGVTDLTPRRYVARRTEPTAVALVDLTVRLRTLYDQVGALITPPTPSAARTGRDLVTIAELERRGALSIMPREASPHDGDVVILGGGRPPVVVEPDVDEPQGILQVVAVDRTRLDAHYVALFLRPDVKGLSKGTVLSHIARDDLRRCRLPRTPLPQQRRYGNAYRRVLTVHQLTRDLANVTGSVLDQTVHALTTGALLPAPDPTSRREGDTA